MQQDVLPLRIVFTAPAVSSFRGRLHPVGPLTQKVGCVSPCETTLCGARGQLTVVVVEMTARRFVSGLTRLSSVIEPPIWVCFRT